jgi:hypothetical protein
LAAQMTFQWHRERREQDEYTPDPYVADVGEKPTEEEKKDTTWPFPSYEQITPKAEPDLAEEANALIDAIEKEVPEVILPEEPKEVDYSKHTYLHSGFAHFKDLKPMVHKPEPTEDKPKITVDAVVEFVPAEPTTVDTTEVKVDEDTKDNTYQIFPDLEEESKKKTYMIKDQGHQIVKSK